MKHLKLTVNGKSYEIDVPPWRTLLDVIREELQLTGTKEGCGLGDCGACTVIMDGRAVNACLVLAVEADGVDIMTVEGLAHAFGGAGRGADQGLDSGRKLHPLQQAFVEQGAIQCGFCTPGMLMSATALLDERPNPTVAEIRHAIRGNLCRCTGYKKIEEAIIQASEGLQGEE